MTTPLTKPTVRVEYAVRLTWPDGHVEVEGRGGRAGAERAVRGHNATNGRPNAAEVVHRTVTETPWEPLTSANEPASWVAA